MQNEERELAETQPAEPSMQEDFDEMKKTVVEGAKSGFAKLSGFMSQAKTEMTKKMDSARNSNNDVSGSASGNQALLDDQDVSTEC
jgi:hypothetical protein